MVENQGWHKIPRSLYDSDTWNELSIAGRLVMIRMLERSNYEQTQVVIDGEPRTIEPGQVLISRKTLIEKTGATNQQIRTAIATMKTTNFLTKETTKGNRSIYTINKGFFKIDIKKQPTKQPRKEPTNQPDQRSKDDIIKDIYDYWNTKEHFVKHRELSDRMIGALNSKLKNYKPEEIMKAFDNYDFVIGSTDHFWTHAWPLDVFLHRSNGFPTFVDEADPKNNYLNSDLKKAYAEEEAYIKEMGGYVT